jgi:ABC-2 type transport system ATP-binding protein
VKETLISIDLVVKRFGNYTASNSISLHIEKGTIFGLLGPNGAGKTTLIRMITNIIKPDSGSIHFNNQILNEGDKNIIGYLPEERGLYRKQSVQDQIRYFAELKGMTKKEALKAMDFWLERMGAESWKQKKINELSKGMQQKVQFITTILHNPTLLVLDEPFSGLDPLNVQLFIDIILELQQQGKTIILSTHQMEQVEKLCEEFALINKGNCILQGNVQEIKKRYTTNTFKLRFEGSADFLQSIGGIEIIESKVNSVIVDLPTVEKQKEFLVKAVEEVIVKRFELIEPTLHDIFIKVVQENEIQSQGAIQ